MFKYLHHVHYVVKNVDEVVAYLEKNFGMKPDSIIINKGNNPAKEALYQIDKTQMQVTEPLTPTSALAKHLAEHGPGVYHVAWGVQNIGQLAVDLAAAGNEMRRKGVDVSPRGYKSVNVEGSTTFGLGLQLIDDPQFNG